MTINTCLDETGIRIKRAISRELEALGASFELLATVNSWGGTLDDDDVLADLEPPAKDTP